ncbi:MAG: hypothetical protein GWP08_04040 [Nitrospiraceae bacterium]|nr:hypothetical protein [Nitrospiraceae bacterium]
MNAEILTLTGTAAFIGLTHTLIGPDHYVPFIVMSQARRWSTLKTALITFVCGVGHVASSVLLGFLGIALGTFVGKLEAFESVRGNLAGWALLGFGLAYFVWGLHRAWRNKPHTHSHTHSASLEHQHEHTHHDDHTHVHDRETRADITPWILFTVFVFGPCEPLIPLVMYPAAEHNMWGVFLVTAVFATVTIGCMLCVVLAATLGLRPLAASRMARYNHALAGFAILACGLAIKLGL